MYATLIIKNIGNLYTCDNKFTIYHHAFVALHHDKIIDLGEHDYYKWVEDSTYIIDAASRAVIPGFIEPKFQLPSGRNKWDVYRKTEEDFFYLQRNGTLTICMNRNYKNPNPLILDLVCVEEFKPVLENFADASTNKNYMVSCLPSVVSQQAMGSLLFYGYHVPEWDVLKSITCNVANTMGLKDRGSLEIGKLGDILVLNEVNIKDFFGTMGRPLYARIIKKGIPVYPSFIRV